MKNALLALALGMLCCRASAQTTKYWDIDGTTAGPGGASPAGVWDGVATNWNTDSLGGAGTISAWSGTTDIAVIAADTTATGAYTITVNGTQMAGGLTIEEGTVTITNGVSPGVVSLGTAPVLVKAGATLVTNSSARIATTAGQVYTLDGGTLRTTNTGVAGSFIDGDSKITLTAAGGTLDYQVTNVLNIFSGPLDGTGSLTKTGAGVLAVSGALTHAGGTIINDGELRIRTTANRLPIAGAVTINGPGILNLNNVSQQIGSLTGNGTVGTGGATLTVSGSASTTFTGAIKNVANAGASGVTTGNGRLTKDGTGVLTLSGVNDLRGRITLINGGIIVTPGAVLSDAIADLFIDGGTLTLNNTAQTVENLTSTVSGTSTGTVVLGAGHTLTTDPAGSTTFAAKITGAGSLVKANVLSGTTNRTLTLTGANDYDGNTTISGGNIAVGSATALGSTNGYTEVASGAELLFTGAATNFTVNEPLRVAGAGNTDGGAISVIASATPTISGPITLTGDTTITVSSTAGATFNNASAITSASNQNLTLKGGSGAGAGGTISGAINLGTGSLTKNEGGTWVLSGNNTYSGGTIINGGKVYANNTSGSATGSGSVTINTGGTLGGTGAVSGQVIANAGGHVAPGTSVESLATGNLTFNADSNLDIEIDSSASLTAAADLLDATGGLTIDAAANLNLTDIAGTSTAFAAGTKFTLVRYDLGTWNLVTFVGKPDDSMVTVGANTFVINYNDTLAGVNFGGGSGTPLNSNYLTLTAVPEASAFLFGGLVCCAAGARRFVRRRRATTAAA